MIWPASFAGLRLQYFLPDPERPGSQIHRGGDDFHRGRLVKDGSLGNQPPLKIDRVGALGLDPHRIPSVVDRRMRRVHLGEVAKGHEKGD